ncbi:MAG: hypothetical protein COV45_03955 [Deltaproteobacteria bacterium CG11_big_fil_rev_8_21_14_0_20_47_16]|nr:MAG: hypothetical protein COV45_03955 [Deltaproteobacteria bacterium CG11_big_fil_rev_8_21_14_0_20_47_16]
MEGADAVSKGAAMTQGASSRYTERVVKESGSTFAWSFGSLSRKQRRGMMALYAFCRVVDDIVDEAWEPLIKEKQLLFWRNQIQIAAGGTSQHPLTIELGFLIQNFGVTEEELTTLLDGVAADCQPVTPRTRADLERYCYGVASIVGIMCLRIFGVSQTAAARHAATQLGYAFQCTNILRDVTTDAATGRCYFPSQELVEFNLTPETLLDSTHHSDAVAFLEKQCDQTWGYFNAAWAEFPKSDSAKLYPARIMSTYYEAILKKIAQDPAAVLKAPVKLGLFRKIGLLLWAGLKRS